MMRLRLLFLLSALAYAGLSHGADFSVREWARDNRLVDAKILKPLAAQFEDLPCEETLDIYITAFFNELAKIRELVSPQSYLLFREIAIAIRTELYPLKTQLPCTTLDRWALIELNIKTKAEMLSNAFVITRINNNYASVQTAK